MGTDKRGPLTGLTAFFSNPGGLIPDKFDLGGKINTAIVGKIDRALGHRPPGDPASATPAGSSAAAIKLAADEKLRQARVANLVPTTQKGTTLLSTTKTSTRLGN